MLRTICCRICGNLFTTNDDNAEICDNCKAAGYCENELYYVKCLMCGREFKTQRPRTNRICPKCSSKRRGGIPAVKVATDIELDNCTVVDLIDFSGE